MFSHRPGPLMACSPSARSRQEKQLKTIVRRDSWLFTDNHGQTHRGELRWSDSFVKSDHM